MRDQSPAFRKRILCRQGHGWVGLPATPLKGISLMKYLCSYGQRSYLAVLAVVCLAGLTATSVFASGVASPSFATTVYGNPDAAVNGKLAVGSSTVGNKSLTVSGVIDFVGAGTVHNYFSQGGGNNMQINTNVDEANTVGDASNSQWKLVLGSSLDQFSIRRSPAGGTYNEDALFFINGATGNVGIATVDTGNGASIPFTPFAKLHVQTDTGTAVRGQASATSGVGVDGFASATSGTTYGVYGQSDSSDGLGVYGYAASGTGTPAGVYGTAASSGGIGVIGTITTTTGGNIGVLGVSHSPSGTGVSARVTATTGNTWGVEAAVSSTNGTAIYAHNDTGSTAGYFYGNVTISGTLSKTAGSFKIDDPLDPAHKYLQHSFVESPDMMNVYNGNVTLDDNGKAVVTMPDWFQALNQDFRYQLTPIGAFAPLYVAAKIKDNQFTIAGGDPGMEVSWQVTGIRHDPYADAHRIQVVVDKPASEQGTYLFPDLYNQPASKGLDHVMNARLSHGSIQPPAAPDLNGGQ